MTLCFHCGEPMNGSRLQAQIEGQSQPVCCRGCQAVAELIAGSGLGDFYRYRNTRSARPDDASWQHDPWRAYAEPELAAQYTHSHDGITSTNLVIDGLRCPACSWLIDKLLQRLPGIGEVNVNAATGRAFITWKTDECTLAEVLRAIAQLGYQPRPMDPTAVARSQQEERRTGLKRLAVSGLGMMQVMMFAVSVYAADILGEQMDATLLSYFRVISLLVTTPVMLYAGAPFLLGAWHAIRARTVSMDVPVGTALVLAYAASVWNTLRGTGEVYFDSITMFIFFLTLGRYVQMSVRQRTAAVTDALARQLPAVAHRLRDEQIEDLPIASLCPGDIVLVRPGETLPADGVLLSTEAQLDESMLTGESLGVHRQSGERLAAGTINTGQPLRLAVSAVGADTTLSHIVGLMRKAQTQRPAMSRHADAAAARFLRYVLLGAGATCAAWMAVDPSRAFEATLAVLVVACPCAFAIATPAAMAAATSHLARQGLLVTDPDALESLASIQHMVFDKTGTLTRGEPQLAQCTALSDLPTADALHIAAALEQASEHPLARSFANHIGHATATHVTTHTGRGVEGDVNGIRYRIGSGEFVAELNAAMPPVLPDSSGGSTVLLGNAHCVLACFEIKDTLRPQAATTINALRTQGIQSQILSGDSSVAVAAIADQCNIVDHFSRHSPQQKLAHLQSLQRAGARIAVVGDGVNDAPMLGAAEVAIAMGRGAALAHAGAGLVLVNNHLPALPQAVSLARRTLRIARQNMLWAATYNLGCLPLAALGFIPPWLAAAGMSLSSIGVVLNATRLLPARQPRPSGSSQLPLPPQLSERAA